VSSQSQDFDTILVQSSKEEITRAFRKLARIFHPDKISDPQQKREAEQRFNDLKEAFDVLTNDGLRAVYDVYGVQGVKSTKQLSHKLKTPSEVSTIQK
jgi:DnaJ family protein C protein 11